MILNNKNKLIIGLITIGIVFFGVVLCFIIQNYHKGEEYKIEQLSATAHDINYVLPYKNKYMGNNSNTVNLFYHLPLSSSNMKFELMSEIYTVQINYNDTLQETGKINLRDTAYVLQGNTDTITEFYETEVQKSLIYNSTAAFALIDNLEGVIYNFSDITYKISRSDIEEHYSDFNNILTEANWKEYVQTPLEDDLYIERTVKNILIEQ